MQRINKYLNSFSLRTKFLISLIFFTLLFITIDSYIIYKLVEGTIKENILDNLEGLSKSKVDQIETFMAGTQKNIEVIANDSQIKRLLKKYIKVFPKYEANSEEYRIFNTENRKKLIFIQKKYNLSDLLFISSTGDVVYSGKKEEDFGTNLLTGKFKESPLAELFKKTKNKDEEIVSNFGYYESSNKVAIFMAQPVTLDGGLIGVLAFQISTKNIFNIVNDYTNLGKTGEIIIAYKVGNNIVFINTVNNDLFREHGNYIPLGTPFAFPIQESVQGKSGSGFSLDYSKKEIIAAWRPIPILKWGLVAKINAEEAFQPLHNLKIKFLIVLIVLLFIIVIEIVWISNEIIQPIKRLTEKIKLMTGEDFSEKLDFESGDEIVVLSKSFQKMSDKLYETNSLIKKSEKMYRDVIDSSPNGIIIHDAKEIMYMNAIALKMVGANSFVDVKGKNPYVFEYPESKNNIEQRYSEEVNKKNGQLIETKLMRLDGSVIEIERASKSIEYNEKSAMQVVINDITKRKETESKLEKYQQNLEKLVDKRTFELYEVNVRLEDEIKKQKKAELVVIKALQKEKELNELKTNFVSMVSHEFRTPLTTILASADFLEIIGQKGNPKQFIEYINTIQNSVDNMRIMLENVLTLGSIERGKIEYMPANVNLKEICDDILDTLKIKYKNKNSVIFNYKTKTNLFMLDGMLIRRIITNLLDNSIKYSPLGSNVIFAISKNNNNLELIIEDNGLGIDKYELNNIFKPFTRGKAVSNIKGNGLGLSIVKEAVDLHNGNIKVDSEIKIGSVFTVTIPIISEEGKNV